jgi:membrane protease YdiL (CAAX protease family)
MSDPTTNPETTRPIVMARPVREESALSAAARAVPTRVAALDMSSVTRGEAFLDVWLVLTVAIFVQYAPSVLLSDWQPAGEGALPAVDSLMVCAKWIEMLLVVTLCAYFVGRNGVALRSFGLHCERIGIQLLWVPLILVCAYAAMVGIGLLLLLVWGNPTQLQTELTQRTEFAGAMPLDDLGLAVPLMLAVAVHEELLFRGLLLPYLRRATGSWIAAIAISSVIFGSLHFHQGSIAMVQITGLAVVLSLMFIVSRSLIAVMVAHFTFDMAQLQLMRWLPEIVKWAEHATSQPS